MIPDDLSDVLILFKAALWSWITLCALALTYIEWGMAPIPAWSCRIPYMRRWCTMLQQVADERAQEPWTELRAARFDMMYCFGFLAACEALASVYDYWATQQLHTGECLPAITSLHNAAIFSWLGMAVAVSLFLLRCWKFFQGTHPAQLRKGVP